MKEKIKLIIVFIIGIIISAVISVTAATIITAGEVSYTSNSQSTVGGALNNLYTKANSLATRVTTLENTTVPNDVIVKTYTCTPSSGACASLTTPNGVDFNNYNLPIIQ